MARYGKYKGESNWGIPDSIFLIFIFLVFLAFCWWWMIPCGIVYGLIKYSKEN